MIKYYSNFLNEDECQYFIELFNNNDVKYHTDMVYKFYYIDLISLKLKTNKFNKYHFSKFRVQMVNESINQIQESHLHHNPWSFIVFLNENFIGGELIFGNEEYKPKIGDMIYFTGDEFHRVNNCIGDRYTLIGFMLNNPLDVEVIKNIL
jgi:predicted 2-oxoglutarate/Fe(II)-dependent dioxygenase YbiX